MPYRIDPGNPRCVQVNRSGRWERVDGGCHGSHEEAVAHLRALTVNVDKAQLVGRFEKFSEEQQIAFGLASVVHDTSGEPLTDLHGDVLDPISLEKSVYAFMHDSREGDFMHVRRDIGEVIESMVITPEKMAVLGKALGVEMPADVPVAWWIGMKIHDPTTWSLVKSGALPMFSITGTGERMAIDA